MSEPTYEEMVGPEVAEDEALEADAKLKAHDLFLRLQASFAPPAYITLEEVRDATGFDGVRTADAMAVSLYRSRGKALWGFEMKVSRNDWLKELKQPEKAESIMRYCHHWALVVPDAGIVKTGELPSSWGMYVAQKTRLKCIVPAPLLEPMPLDMRMFTAITYAISSRQSKIDEVTLRKERDAGYQEGVKRSGIDRYETLYTDLQARITAFEKASGLSIQHGWNKPEKIGAAVRTLMEAESEVQRVMNQLKRGVEDADRLKGALKKHVEILESALIGATPPPDEED